MTVYWTRRRHERDRAEWERWMAAYRQAVHECDPNVANPWMMAPLLIETTGYHKRFRAFLAEHDPRTGKRKDGGR